MNFNSALQPDARTHKELRDSTPASVASHARRPLAPSALSDKSMAVSGVPVRSASAVHNTRKTWRASSSWRPAMVSLRSANVRCCGHVVCVCVRACVRGGCVSAHCGFPLRRVSGDTHLQLSQCFRRHLSSRQAKTLRAELHLRAYSKSHADIPTDSAPRREGEGS